MFLNVFLDKPIRHINRYLEPNDYAYMKKVIYTLGTYGFRFTDIRHLFLELFGEGKSAKWAKEYSKEREEIVFLQKPVYVYLYREESKLQKQCDVYAEKTLLKYGRKEKQEERLKEIIDTSMSQKIVLLHLHSQKILSVEELLSLKKENRRK